MFDSSLNERLRVILQELTAELERQSANLRSLEEEHRPPDPQRHEEPPQTSPTLELPIEAQESLRPEEKTDGPSFPIASAPSSARSAASKERKTITFEPDAAWEVREYDGGEARNGLGTQSDSNWTMDGRGLTEFEETVDLGENVRQMPVVKVKHARPQVALNVEQQRRLTLQAMRGEKTRQFQVSQVWYVINPESSKYATYWQFVTFAAMIFVAFVTPVQVGLFPMRIDGLMIFSLCVDAVFLADMVLQFFTMYPKRSARGIIWEDRLKKITKHYLKTWFFLDFTTLIPFDLISLASGADSLKEFKGIKVVRVLRLLKLMRIFRTSKLIHKLEVTLHIPYQQMALIRFLLILVLVCHWMACLWAMTLNLADSYYPKWIDSIADADLAFGIDTRTSEIRIYIAAFYFCSYTMTSVGYGDIGPQNIFERVTCTVIVLVAGLCWAYILGEVGAIVTDMNAEKQSFRKMMNGLNKMMQEQGLPQELRRRLRSFFLSNKHQAQFARDQKLLTTMSPQLQSEVSITLNWQWLLKVPFFREFIKVMDIKEQSGINTDPYRACIADIAHHMDSVAYAQQEMFGESQVLYILSKGLVVLNSRVALVGSVWGEDFVLADRELIRRTSAYALTYLEVLCLTGAKFFGVVERRATTCPQLKLIVRHHCVRMAARRGILMQASKLRRLNSPPVSYRKTGSKESQISAFSAQSHATPPQAAPPETVCPVLPPVPGTMPEDLAPLAPQEATKNDM
ncbi:unnamed protein product [Durusdinium trenchii]|uniref:Uncharacterized protein n=2 Tax=Durusdinium trenchii TaxID=1381693 RepID=A0ABP0LI26_9DINO